jgi:hypothetical protein
VDYGVPAVREYVLKTAEKAGGSEVEVTISQEDLYIDNYSESEKMYIETRIMATAEGIPT